MSSILNFLRDPIWQSIGAIVAILAIFISSTSTPNLKNELSLEHIQRLKFNKIGFPIDQVKLLIRGSNQDINNIVVDSFVVINNTEFSIKSSDYIKPIELITNEGARKILSVQPDKSQDKSVNVDWIKKGENWITTPPLLNKGEFFSFLVISSIGNNNSEVDFKFDARIANVDFKDYRMDETTTKRIFYMYRVRRFELKRWREYLSLTDLSVVIRGYYIYWFLSIQILLFISTSSLSVHSGWINNLSLYNILRFSFILSLSTATSEILIDFFVTNNGNIENLHPVSWPIIIFHIAFIGYMANRALQRRSSSSV